MTNERPEYCINIVADWRRGAKTTTKRHMHTDRRQRSTLRQIYQPPGTYNWQQYDVFFLLPQNNGFAGCEITKHAAYAGFKLKWNRLRRRRDGDDHNPLLSPLESATSNNMKLVHWPMMGGLLHLVQ